jgi:hypothetical protein
VFLLGQAIDTEQLTVVQRSPMGDYLPQLLLYISQGLETGERIPKTTTAYWTASDRIARSDWMRETCNREVDFRIDNLQKVEPDYGFPA